MTFLYTFFIMFAFWIMLSGKFDLFHLMLGVISCLLVALISNDLLFEDKKKRGRLQEAFRFIAYIPWLLYQIFIANLYVAYLALHPRMMDKIDPKIIHFKSKLKKDIANVTFANSITLTPGTITVDVIDGEYFVHSLSEKSSKDLPGEMEERIGWIFKET